MTSRGTRFGFHDDEIVAGFRRTRKAQHFHRLGRAGRFHVLALVVDQRAYAAPLGAGHHEIAELQRAALDEHRGHRAAALVELGFDHRALGRAMGIGLEVEHFGLQQDRLFQLVEAGALERRHFDREHVAAEFFDLDFVLQQFVFHPRRLASPCRSC